MSLKNHVMQAVGLALLAIPVILAMPTQAQDAVEEIVVTGSYIKHSPEDAPVPIDVIDSEELFNTGNPSVVELVKTLGVSSGVDGETNQFQSNGLEGTANVNLRGLGAGRNLVLLNGRRNVFSPYPVSEQQQLFVDINMIPGVALDRVEVLKDGAAATYGSDAISGVVNFITRSDFEGTEFALSHKDIQGSDGDQDFGVIWGKNFGRTHVMAAFGYSKRNQLRTTERDWAIKPFGYMGNGRGYTGIPNPGSYGPAYVNAEGNIVRKKPGAENRVNVDGTTVDESKVYNVYQLDADGAYVMVNGAPVVVGQIGGHKLAKEDENTAGTFVDLTAEELDELGVAPTGNTLVVAKTTDATPKDVPNDYGNLGFTRDARCADFIGDASASATGGTRTNCTYNYAYFDNLIEEETRNNFFGVITHEFDNESVLTFEFLYGENEVPEWHTSPSYPPQVLVDTNFDTGRIIPKYHPGLVAYAELHGTEPMRSPSDPSAPALDSLSDIADEDCAITGRDDTSCVGLLFFGRPFGISGPSNLGIREHETSRIAVGYAGTLANDVDYNLSALVTSADGKRTSPDIYIERLNLALKGFGGPNCAATETTPGANGCEFYNPFSNAIQYPQSKYAKIAENLEYKAELSNSEELRQWLNYGVGTEVESDLAVFEAILSGQSAIGVGWAFGAQYREEKYVVKPFEQNDLTLNPCITAQENENWRDLGASGLCDRGTPNDATDDYEGSGQFGFLAGTTPFDEKQDVTAIFGEVAIPFNENVEAQISMRYEDYGGDVGDTLDPKVAVRWQAMDNIVVRGSASTTFRGPTLNQLGGRSTTLSYVAPTGSFKAVDTDGNPNLEAESAKTLNLGALFEQDDLLMDDSTFRFSVDYWSFDFDNPIIKESFNAIIANAFSGEGGVFNGANPYSGRINCGGPCDGEKASSVQRIRVDMINGPQIETDGFDIKAGLSTSLTRGELDVNFEYTLVTSYDVGASDLSGAFDALGKINDTVSFLRPVIEDKWKLGATYRLDVHTITGITNFTGSYEDAKTSAADREVDDHITFDLHYNVSLENMGDMLGESAVWVSVYNLTDEDPPFARLDLNYDPYTHNPFGRMIKVGVRHKF